MSSFWPEMNPARSEARKQTASAMSVAVPKRRREGSWEWLTVRGAAENNLRGIDVAFPLGRFVAITGVSGSGKSSLVTQVLHPALAQRIWGSREPAGKHDRIEGIVGPIGTVVLVAVVLACVAGVVWLRRR